MYVGLTHAAPPNQYKVNMPFSTNWLSEGSSRIHRQYNFPVIASTQKFAEKRSIKLPLSYDLIIIIIIFLFFLWNKFQTGFV